MTVAAAAAAAAMASPSSVEKPAALELKHQQAQQAQTVASSSASSSTASSSSPPTSGGQKKAFKKDANGDVVSDRTVCVAIMVNERNRREVLMVTSRKHDTKWICELTPGLRPASGLCWAVPQETDARCVFLFPSLHCLVHAGARVIRQSPRAGWKRERPCCRRRFEKVTKKVSPRSPPVVWPVRPVIALRRQTLLTAVPLRSLASPGQPAPLPRCPRPKPRKSSRPTLIRATASA